jgi:hypothetical protein
MQWRSRPTNNGALRYGDFVRNRSLDRLPCPTITGHGSAQAPVTERPIALPPAKGRTVMSSGRRGPIFTPDQIDVMHAAFVIACGQLRLKPGDRAAEDTAVRIVDLARTGVCDVEGLTAAVLVHAEYNGEADR